MFRERLLASKNKQAVSAEIEKSAPGPRPEDIIRDPHVLEFPGFSDDAAFRESDLERAQKKPSSKRIAWVLAHSTTRQNAGIQTAP